MASNKEPWFPFYVRDWLTDTAVRSVSRPARSLWIDMLCAMHMNDRRGYLELNGNPMTLDQIASNAGCSTDEAHVLVRELESAGVFSRTPHGTIYSRRMVRDEMERQANAARQAKHRAKSNGDVTPMSQHSNAVYTESESENTKTNPRAKENISALASDSFSPEADADTQRLKARTRWIHDCSRLWRESAPGQSEADRTSTERLFDRFWPRGCNPRVGQAAYDEASRLVTRAGRARKPMAWLTSRLAAMSEPQSVGGAA